MRREDAEPMLRPATIRRRDDLTSCTEMRPLPRLWIERTAWVVGLRPAGDVRRHAAVGRGVARPGGGGVSRRIAAAGRPEPVVAQACRGLCRSAEAPAMRPRRCCAFRKLTLEVPVYGDTSDLNLDRGAGRIPGTAGLDQSGNIGIAAHRDGFFRKLKDVELGMDIYPRARRHARSAITSPRSASCRRKRARCSRPPTTPSVTLVTCYPFYFVGSAPQRFIVRGELDETQTHNEVADSIETCNGEKHEYSRQDHRGRGCPCGSGWRLRSNLCRQSIHCQWSELHPDHLVGRK